MPYTMITDASMFGPTYIRGIAFLVSTALFGTAAEAQSNAIFNGGSGDGHASLEFAQPSFIVGIYNGGVGDGWSSSTEASNVPVGLDVYLFLEGPFDPGTQLMRDDLRAAGLVPLTEPYTALGYPQVAGGGGETTNAALLAISGSDAVVDWVRVELRDAADPTILRATRQALVRRDGTVVNSGGGQPLSFGVTIGGAFHVVVRHRNHLGAMTASPIAFTGVVPTLSFLNSFTATYGTNARKVIGTDYLLWAGDVNSDHQLKYTGTTNDRDPILTAIGGVLPTNTVTGQYRIEDVNMDAVVKYTGASNDRDPILQNIGGVLPTNTRAEQVP